MEFPVELTDLLRQVVAQLTAYQAAFDSERDFRYWDAVASARGSLSGPCPFRF